MNTIASYRLLYPQFMGLKKGFHPLKSYEFNENVPS